MASSKSKNKVEKEKPVELGFLESEKDEWKLSSAYFPSKFGGKPSWLDLENLPNPELLKCPSCDEQMRFLLQVYAPQDSEEAFHRTIFIFVCLQKRCCVEKNSNKNWTILRCQLKRENEFYSFEPPKFDKSNTGINPTKFGVKLCKLCGAKGSQKCSKCQKVNYCSKGHQVEDWKKHKADCNKEDSTSEDSSDTFNLKEYEIVIDTEVLPKNKEKEKTDKEKLDDFQKLVVEGKAGTLDENCAKDLLEASSFKSDKAFNKFKKRVDYNKDQILRYDRGGEPLWVSSENTPELNNLPSCPSCKGPRSFEFQLMPQLLNYMELDMYDSFDWGTIAVYTCQNDCYYEGEQYKKEISWRQDFKEDELDKK